MDLDLDLPTGTGRVLLVDDDEAVRGTVRLMLEVLGYEVEEASDGPSALALLRAGDVPDAVVLDLQMPHMPGEEVLVAIRALNAGLPVIVLTGSSQEAVEGLGASGYLQKPFTVQEVGRCVRRAMGRDQ